MNILFLTISHITDLNASGIYTDLMREFRDKGHEVYIVSPIERKYKSPTFLKKENDITLLKVKTFNLQKTNFIEKGVGTLAIEFQFYSAIKKYFTNIRFDLILYSTPPITFTKVVKNIKKRDQAKSYLLLKDIFPQNAVDLEVLSIRNPIYWYFKKKERNLYKISDVIGCMSPANVFYLKNQNPWLQHKPIEVCPNCIEPLNDFVGLTEKLEVRKKYGVATESFVFLYGGNLGKPQGLDFLLTVIQNSQDLMNVFFLIIGSGTEYPKLKRWFDKNKPRNAQLFESVSKADFDLLVQSCDVGMIFLDRRFTIPNFPSRLLSYLECSKPVIAATDKNTDLGSIIVENGFGLWSESGNLQAFRENLIYLTSDINRLKIMGEKGRKFLEENYHVSNAYSIIMNHFRHV